jgi:hypothetical protein
MIRKFLLAPLIFTSMVALMVAINSDAVTSPADLCRDEVLLYRNAADVSDGSRVDGALARTF